MSKGRCVLGPREKKRFSGWSRVEGEAGLGPDSKEARQGGLQPWASPSGQ
jgi:hypothetical protein